MSRRRCKGTNKRREPCGATPQRDREYCATHDPLRPAESRFGTPEQASRAGALGGRPPKARPSQIAHRLVEENVAAVLRPHFRALGYDIEADADQLRLVAVDGGGVKLYGKSKYGAVVVSAHDDLGAMIAAAEKLLDRVYGKPRQALEHTGDDGGPIELDGAGLDLRKLTRGELDALEQLLARAQPGR